MSTTHAMTSSPALIPTCARRRTAWFMAMLSFLLGITGVENTSAASAEIVLDFESASIGQPVTSWVEQDVRFALAHEPRESKAPGRVMFFPHLATQHKGVLCAMAAEPIPVQATFPHGASSVTVVLWGSTGCAARLDAFDADGKVVASASLPVVPARTTPGDPVPFCELTVQATAIAYIQFSGPRAGEFLAADELRFTPLASSATPVTNGSGAAQP